MKSHEIREIFIEYFVERGHRKVPSSSLVPDDPSLLLTNAGMVQFKPYFLKEEEPDYTRATTVQKCLRTTDIESVGKTARHNTFFEMLGNFSFGDYYKESVIPWAWELITGKLAIDPEMLWVSVFTGDEEAERIWKQSTAIRPERIIRLGAEDNFWDMGATGPCGPCSEILYDRGEEYACGPDCSAGCDCDRFLELWNLVFMQYDRQPDFSLEPLPSKNIDTGMGLERVAAIKQGVSTIFETDLIKPIVDHVFGLSGVRMGDSPETDVSLKVVSDHARAATFLIADGVIPSNEGRGYILRRLLRRAVRHGKLLDISGYFVSGMADVVVESMGGVYPELVDHHKLISGVVDAEEERFGQTLEQGLDFLSETIEESERKGARTIDGATVFYLHDTLGFPVELTEEIASAKNMVVDRESFGRLMQEQKERARTSREEEAESGTRELFAEISKTCGPSLFEGYECSRATATVTGVIVDSSRVERAEGEPTVEVILDRTPFYAESGGQVGDTGIIKSDSGTVIVENTFYSESGLIVHRGRLEGVISEGERVEADVDAARRADISRNHSATHVLHWALREVLGSHAKQAGSLVTPDRLRFDFTHFQPLDSGELERIEQLANEKVLENLPVSAAEMKKQEALREGAIALFGEKYSDDVRMVSMGDFSRELCGGIHVERTGSIGPIRIVSETGIGAGLRRIEATSGRVTLDHYRRMEETIGETSGLLKVGAEQVPGKVNEVLDRLRALEREVAREESRAAVDLAGTIVEEGRWLEIAGERILLAELSGVDQKKLRDLADIVMEREGCGAVALAAESGKKAHLVVKLDRRMVEKGLNARDLAMSGGNALGGGGGGRDDMAVAGGSSVGSLSESLDAVESAVKSALGSR